MSQSGQKLIQAALEAAAMARGEDVPGAVIHPASTQVAGPGPQSEPGAASPSAAPGREADGDPA